MLEYTPSKLAASAIYTARCTLNGFEEWNKTCEFHTGYNYKEEELLACKEDGWFPSKGRNREANRSSQEVQHLKVLLCCKN
ncbi:hypothetical protein DY000_02009116 [Brassica cretica]|uniref:Cyclin C-terminal domain-containing protein n=1 Tax=Brassica cretica TaxID=69181 RepID=A0ABQ7CLP9_BRACR|nr:hypothetical protein DY000_02009116 [Brassica cretica]